MVAALVLGACGSPPASTPSTTASPPVPAPTISTTLPDAPGRGALGEVLGVTELQGPAVPAGARAWHLAYGMRGVDGAPATATALLVVPTATIDGPRPIIAWGHPTRGTADTCAPSLDGPAGIPHLAGLLADGWAVVAPDLEGLGVPGPHPYLVGSSAGDALLGALVAARHVDGAGIEAGSPAVLWGFSQGGHAVAFAGQRAAAQVPDLQLIGVAVAAPVSDVTHFTQRAERRPDQLGVLVTVVGGMAAAYPDVDPAAVLTDGATDRLSLLEERCIGDVVEAFTGPVAEVSRRPVAEDPALAARLAENLAGQAPVPAPVLVVQGDADDIVDAADTAALAARWCDLGVTVTAVVRPGGDHGTPADDVLRPWLVDRLAGRPATSTCAGPPLTREPPGLPSPSGLPGDG